MWTDLERLPCLSTLSSSEREWIDLLQAVGPRDGGDMAKRAEALLQTHGEPSDRQHYLVAVAMLGRVAGGDPRPARRLWDGMSPEGRRGPLSLLMNVLAAHDRSAHRPTP